MKSLNIFKSIIAVVSITSMSACSDIIENTLSHKESQRIGMPTNVETMNVELSRSRAAGERVAPDMHTTVSQDGLLFCKFTSMPGINSAQSTTMPLNNTANSRGAAITTGSFYDSYDLYTYLYSSAGNFASLASTLTPTYYDEEVKKAMNWMTSQFWPGSGNKCAFFAYAPYHAVGVNPAGFAVLGWPTFHYKVPTNVLEQNDLLVTRDEDWDAMYGSSGVPGTDYANINVPGDYYEPDSIRFDHACTGIRFAIGSKMAPGVIKKIEIRNVYGTGDYWYQDESWHNIDTLKTFVLEQDFEIRPGETNKVLNNADNIFMMIPQTTPAGATMAITIDDGEEHTIVASIANDNWQKGHTVTYYLSTFKDESSYVLAVAPSGGDVSLAGGTKNVTINSYKQSYYGTQIAVPWTLEYNYYDDNIGLSAWQNTTTDIVPSITFSGTGSTTSAGEVNAIQIARQVERSKTWRSTHTATLRAAAHQGSAASPVDLSAGKRTANCYVVSAPGHYSFPLVYGNARNADGSANTNAYGTATFVDHNGVQIDDPYVYRTNGSAYTPDNACIVWQDAPHLVTPSSVKLSSDKHSIEFEIEEKNICAGNCVIAVRDASNTIMWSWHIWVTDHSMTNTIEVHNKASVGGEVISNFMEVPLGWCDEEVRIRDKRTFQLRVRQTETGGVTSTISFDQFSADSTYEYGVNAPYYQWGRKDPMLPSNGMGNYDKPYYDNQSQWLIINSYASTAQAIKAPFTFYYVRNNDWNDSHNFQFWNKNFSTDSDPGITNTATLKTVYDPSVSGFALPRTAAFTNFTSSGDNTSNGGEFNVSGNINKGWNFYTNGWRIGNTVFFHALGIRDTNSGRPTGTGAVANAGEDGRYWSAGANSASGGRVMNFSSGYVSPQSWDIRSYGLTVRPVSE